MTNDTIEIKTFVDVQGVTWLERKDVTTFERLPYRMRLEDGRIDISVDGNPVFRDRSLYDVIEVLWSSLCEAVNDALDGKVGKGLLADQSDVPLEVTLEEGDRIKICIGPPNAESATFDRVSFVEAFVKAGLEFYQFCHRSFVNADWDRERKQTLDFIQRHIEELKALKAKSDAMT